MTVENNEVTIARGQWCRDCQDFTSCPALQLLNKTGPRTTVGELVKEANTLSIPLDQGEAKYTTIQGKHQLIKKLPCKRDGPFISTGLEVTIDL